MTATTMKTYQYEGTVRVYIQTNATSIEEAQEKMMRGEGELTSIDYQSLGTDSYTVGRYFETTPKRKRLVHINKFIGV